MKIIERLKLMLALNEAELRTGIALIEAAEVDQFQRDMANITDSEEARQELRDAALALGQLGISGFHDVQKMVQLFYIVDSYGVTLEDIRLLGKIKYNTRREAGL